MHWIYLIGKKLSMLKLYQTTCCLILILYLCTNVFFPLVWYNKIGMAHSIFIEMFKTTLYFFLCRKSSVEPDETPHHAAKGWKTKLEVYLKVTQAFKMRTKWIAYNTLRAKNAFIYDLAVCIIIFINGWVLLTSSFDDTLCIVGPAIDVPNHVRDIRNKGTLTRRNVPLPFGGDLGVLKESYLCSLGFWNSTE